MDLAFIGIENLTITRYTRSVKYRDSFKKFMRRVKKHDFVIMLISDNFLKSQACMYEVSELLTDEEFEKKLLFIIISDGDVKYLKRLLQNQSVQKYIHRKGKMIIYAIGKTNIKKHKIVLTELKVKVLKLNH